MASEFDIQMSAQHHQRELLTEASTRRLNRTTDEPHDDPAPTGRRLQALLRRLSGAPSFS
jgi:hypothetical protein